MEDSIGGVLVGEDEGVCSKGVLAWVLLISSNWERLDVGLVLAASGRVKVLGAVDVVLFAGSREGGRFGTKRPELSLERASVTK